MTEVAKIEPQETIVPADPLISMIERMAMDPSVDLDRLERMLKLREKHEADNAKKAYAEAFAKMQSALPIIPERGAITNRNGEVQSTYPLWEDVVAGVRGPLADNGLSMTFDRRREDDKVYFGCIITHELGHSTRSEIDLPRDDSGSKNAVQGEGSTVSYGQRYSSKMAINWTSEGTEDDDGRRAGSDTISADQFMEIKAAIDAVGIDAEIVAKAEGVGMLEALPAKRFKAVMDKLAIDKKAMNTKAEQ